MHISDLDSRVRLAAFDFLSEETLLHGEVLARATLAIGFGHHAAFDRHVLGIKPELTVDLRIDILRETDGPMLRHGLQGFQGAPILVPRHADSRPNRGFLAERYELFRKAG